MAEQAALKCGYRSDGVTRDGPAALRVEASAERGADCALDATAIQKGTRVLISLWDSLMFERVAGTGDSDPGLNCGIKAF